MDFSRLHERMVRNVFLNVELMLNDGIEAISEYDIQGLMFLFFRRALVNTTCRAEREREGKVDCVLYEGITPSIFYEIKTYFKDNEKIIKKHFDHDIDKMVQLLMANDYARGFILVAGKQYKFKGDVLKKFDFISKHLEGGQRKWTKYRLLSGAAVRLRPSRKQHYGRSVLITWEVRP